MIKSLLRLLAIVVVALVVYNLFYGTVEEKDNAQQVVKEFKDVGAAVKDLLKAEKLKLDGGKYDEVLGDIGNIFQKLKARAKDLDEKHLDRITRLEEKRKGLKERLQASKDAHAGSIAKVNNTAEEKKLKLDLERLFQDTERLVDDIDKQVQE